MSTATARIVVQATPADKDRIVAKAQSLDLPIAELMRRGALAYRAEESDAELAALADAAQRAAERACSALDDALAFVAASERRIQAMTAPPAAVAANAGKRSGRRRI